MDVGGVDDPGVVARPAHGLGHGLHDRHRADLFGREGPGPGEAERQSLDAVPRARRTGRACEHRGVGREHALATAGPDEGDAAPDLLWRAAEVLGQHELVGQRRKAAREVVGAAVALGLADQRHDGGGIDRAGHDAPLQFRDVARRRHGDLVDTDLHHLTPGLVPTARVRRRPR